MTQEAITLYMSKLATGGMLAFHVSNRSLKLDSVLAALAKHNDAMTLSFADGEHDPETGKDPSEWVVMARHSPAFESLAQKNSLANARRTSRIGSMDRRFLKHHPRLQVVLNTILHPQITQIV